MADRAMNYEESRLATFTNWPSNCPVRPAELARNGFYYSGKDLQVTCYSCEITLYDWSSNNNDVEFKHWICSPNCRFIKHRLHNVPIPVVVNEDCLKPYRINHFRFLTDARPGRNNSGNDVCGNSSSCSSSSSIKGQIHLAKGGPENPQYVINFPIRPQYLKQTSLKARLKTFYFWPDDSPVKPYDLAEAGFLYTGISDKVVCFNCSIVLNNWKVNDVAWDEHYRFSPTCELVQGKFHVKPELSKSVVNTTTNTTPTVTGETQTNEPASSYQTLNLIDNEILKNQTVTEDNRKEPENEPICKICMIEPICIVFLPCGHLISCKTCSLSLTYCAICREYISQKIKVYMS